jgi:hypothetical protein
MGRLGLMTEHVPYMRLYVFAFNQTRERFQLFVYQNVQVKSPSIEGIGLAKVSETSLKEPPQAGAMTYTSIGGFRTRRTHNNKQPGFAYREQHQCVAPYR